MIKNKNTIRGFGGGGGKGGGDGGRAPIEAPDTLISIQNAKILDLVSEGEIGGLVDGLKSIYLNDTPIQNADETYNFNSVIMEQRVGTQSQSFMEGFDGAEAETIVGTEVKNSASVTRSISNVNDTAVRVTLGFPQMTKQDTETGDLNGTSVQIAIDIQNNGGGFIPQYLRKIFSSSPFTISSGAAVTTQDSTDFHITVSWAGQSIQTPQTCTFQLQYRAVGDVTWLVNQTYTFSGGSTVDGGIGSIGSGINNVNTAAGQKTFTLNLPSDTYEFRAVKTTGSKQNMIPGNLSSFGTPPSVGIEYGGTVSITAGDLYVPDATDVISGKCISRYQKAYRISLPSPGPWEIRVRRLTADNGSASLQNKTYFDSFTEIIEAKLTYPNSAYIGLRIDAKQFNSIPVRGFEIYGLLIRVPVNYDPLTRQYTGSWDGTFKTAWSDNPAWVFYDMATSDRYGLGEFVDASQVDKWSLYTIAQYCDATVPDGFGGIEPRFTCNLYLQTREQAFNVIQNLASVFRAITWWSEGAITASQDSPKPVSQIFTKANVIGDFSYSGSSGRTRHNVVLVGWNDPQDGYRQKIEYVEDADSISRYGVNQTEVVAFGCSSRGQAHRMGRAVIYSEKQETETITFRVGMDTIYSGPGDVIQTADSNRAGIRFGGRLVSATTSQVVLDNKFDLLPTLNYNISCILSDGSVEVRPVTNTPELTETINVSPDFTSAPQAYSMWVLSSEELIPESWRIVGMAEVEKTQIDITALAYRPDKYAAIEENLVLQPLPLSLINASQPNSPAGVQFVESLYLSGLNVVSVKGILSWQTVIGAVSYSVTYLRENQNLVSVDGLVSATLDIQPMQEGNYTINVYAVNIIGRRSQASTISVIVNGKTTLPVDVENFSVFKVSGIAQASWTAHPDLDVQVGGNVVVRHTPKVLGASWEDGVILDTFAGISVMGILPLISGTYMAKAVDSGGRHSENMVSFVVTEGMITGFTTVATITEDPTFSGTKTGLTVASSAIKLNGVLTGTYEFTSVLDLTTVATRRFEVDISALSFDIGVLIDSRTDLIDSWANIDGNSVDDCDATIYASVTNDDPSGSPTWSPWTPFFVSDFTCRGAKFKMVLESATLDHNISVDELVVHVKEYA